MRRMIINGHYFAQWRMNQTGRFANTTKTARSSGNTKKFRSSARRAPAATVPKLLANHCYSALRLPNGNTLIGTGNGHSVIEVTPAKEIVWQISQDDLPGIQLAWITQLQVLKNGNIIVGNCHAGDKNPQVIEVSRDKKVVWSFKDFKNFGNAVPVSFVLDEEGLRSGRDVHYCC